MPSVRLRHLLQFLSNQNRQVTSICPEGPPSSSFRLPGITVLPLRGASKWSYVFRAALKVVRLVKRNPSEIVIASIPGIQSLMAAALARSWTRIPFPLILEVRDPFSFNPGLPWSAPKRAAGRLMERLLLRAPDGAIFLTTAIQSIYLEGFKGSYPWKSKNTVITNGYEMPKTVPGKTEGKKAPLTFSYIGHFYDRRHPIEFLSALRDYLHDHPETPALQIQMAGQVLGNALQRRVKLVCEDPLLQKCIRWLGTISHDQATSLMQNSDVNLLITHDQGSEYAIPGKLFEYMGARRPVLAITRDPLVKQLMGETRLGWICEDRPALMQWFTRYLNNAQPFQDWQPNERAMSAYQWQHIHPIWLDFIEGRLSSKR